MNTYSKDVIDAKFETVRHELRGDIAKLETNLGEKIGNLDSKLSGEISALRGDFREFKGWMLGVGAVVGIVIPIITGIVMFWLNRAFPVVPHP